MTFARRLTLMFAVAALLGATVYGVGWRLSSGAISDESTAPDRVTDTPRVDTSPTLPSSPAVPTDSAPTDKPSEAPTSEAPELTPGPAVLTPGDENDEVADLQARLRQIDWFDHDVTGFYGDVTGSAVSGFQAKREIPVTGEVDQRTMDRLLAMTSAPTEAELSNRGETNVAGALDPRCLSGRVLCIDKTSQTLRWVVEGRVTTTVDVRFGSEYSPTREGVFEVDSKSRDHVSSLYGSAMPFSMFFSGGQAVHYSSDFASVGYGGASHGCVNVRDYDALAGLYDHVDVGDTVIVYRS